MRLYNWLVDTYGRLRYKKKWKHNKAYPPDFSIRYLAGDRVRFRLGKQELIAPHLVQLQQQYAGKTAHVILSGPSINTIRHPAALNREFCMAVNRSPAYCVEHHLTLDAYIVDDPRYLKEHIQQFVDYARIARCVFLSYRSVCLLMQHGVDLSSLPLYVFGYFYMPYHRPRPSPVVPYFATDVRKGMGKCSTVAYLAVQILHHLGFSEVALFGMDLSVDGHFYEEDNPWPQTLHGNWEKGIEEPFRLLKQVCENEGWRVWNCSPASCLDAAILPKVDPNDYLQQ